MFFCGIKETSFILCHDSTFYFDALEMHPTKCGVPTLKKQRMGAQFLCFCSQDAAHYEDCMLQFYCGKVQHFDKIYHVCSVRSSATILNTL